MSILLWEYVLAVYEESMKGKGLSPLTITRYRIEYLRYMKACHNKGLLDVRETTAATIRSYILTLQTVYSAATVQTALKMLWQVYRLLYQQEKILVNPMDQVAIKLKRQEKEKGIVSEEEMVTFLESIRPTTAFTLRDRALFEVLYVTGMRIGECVKLTLDDVDIVHREVFIREGKGRKDRIVPLGSIALGWVKLWIRKGLSRFARKERGNIFISSNGKPLTKSQVNRLFKKYLEQAGIDRKGIAVHSIRHSCATHLLAHGADIRYVQELLGHASIETTVLYTKGIAAQLTKVQRRYHPRENELYEEEPSS